MLVGFLCCKYYWVSHNVEYRLFFANIQKLFYLLVCVLYISWENALDIVGVSVYSLPRKYESFEKGHQILKPNVMNRPTATYTE